MKYILHKIAHLFGWNLGTVETWHSNGGTLMVGFRCKQCGKLTGIHPAPARIFKR